LVGCRGDYLETGGKRVSNEKEKETTTLNCQNVCGPLINLMIFGLFFAVSRENRSFYVGARHTQISITCTVLERFSVLNCTWPGWEKTKLCSPLLVKTTKRKVWVFLSEEQKMLVQKPNFFIPYETMCE